jgi:hypothetical protein
MWNTIILNIILSIIIIFTAHHIWEYCKSNYTVKKTKNLIESRESKYKLMLENIGQSQEMVIFTNGETPESTNIQQPKLAVKDFVDLEEKEWIQKELDGFIDSL